MTPFLRGDQFGLDDGDHGVDTRSADALECTEGNAVPRGVSYSIELFHREVNGQEQQATETYSWVMSEMEPHTMEKMAKMATATKIRSFLPRMSLNFA